MGSAQRLIGNEDRKACAVKPRTDAGGLPLTINVTDCYKVVFFTHILADMCGADRIINPGHEEGPALSRRPQKQRNPDQMWIARP